MRYIYPMVVGFCLILLFALARFFPTQVNPDPPRIIYRPDRGTDSLLFLTLSRLRSTQDSLRRVERECR